MFSWDDFIEEPYAALASPRAAMNGLRNRHKGERCFIIGNGPSLNEVPLVRLNEKFTFAVNGIFYKTDECGFRPFFYVVEDKHVMADNIERIRCYQPRDGGMRFFPSRYRFSGLGGKSTWFFNMNRGFYSPRSPYFEVPRFSVDCSRRVYVGQSVTIVNLQLAYWLGFSEVVLIGMDFNYALPSSVKVDGNVYESTENDVNHFHPDYFGKGKKWHDPKLHNVLKSYQLCKLMYEMDGRKIYNATAGGKLEVFERRDLRSFL